MPLPPDFDRGMNVLVWAIVLAVCVWLLYLAIKLAQHVQAWPF